MTSSDRSTSTASWRNLLTGRALWLTAWVAALMASMFYCGPVPALKFPSLPGTELIGISEDSRTLITLNRASSARPNPFGGGELLADAVQCYDLISGEMTSTPLRYNGHEKAGESTVFLWPPKLHGDYLHGSIQHGFARGSPEVILNWRTGSEIRRRSDQRFESIVEAGPYLLVTSPTTCERVIPGRDTFVTDWFCQIPELGSLRYSADERRALASRKEPDELHVYDIPEERLVCVIPGLAAASCLSADGSSLASVGAWESLGDSDWSRTWKLHDTSTGRLEREHVERLKWNVHRDGPLPKPQFIRFLADGTRVALCSEWGVDKEGGRRLSFGQGFTRLQVFDCATGQLTLVPREASLEQSPFPVSVPRERLPTAAIVHNSEIVDLATGDRPLVLGKEDLAIDLSSDERWLITEHEPTEMWKWLNLKSSAISPWLARHFSKQNQRHLTDLKGWGQYGAIHQDATAHLFSANSRRLVTRTSDQILVWNLPPDRPWIKAFLGSLIVPLIWLARSWKKSRSAVTRRTEGEVAAPAA